MDLFDLVGVAIPTRVGKFKLRYRPMNREFNKTKTSGASPNEPRKCKMRGDCPSQLPGDHCFRMTINKMKLSISCFCICLLLISCSVSRPPSTSGASGASPNSPFTAIQASDLRKISSWLVAGNDPNQEFAGGPYGWATPLGFAASCGNVEICRLLIKHGALLDAIGDNQTMTALMCACSERQVDAAKFLVNSGANINIQTHGGWTALMFAAKIPPYGQLVGEGASPAATESVPEAEITRMRTDALRQGNEIVTFLLQHGADTTLTNAAGETVFDMASFPITKGTK